MMGIRRSVHQLELCHPRLLALVSMLSLFLWKIKKHTRDKKRSTCRRRKKRKIKCVVHDNDVDLSAGWRRFPHSWCQQTYNKCKKNGLNYKIHWIGCSFSVPIKCCSVFLSHLVWLVRSSLLQRALKEKTVKSVLNLNRRVWSGSFSGVFTVLNDQLDVDLVVIEPARDLHPAAVLATVTPPSV